MKRLWSEKLKCYYDGLEFETRTSQLETIDGSAGKRLELNVPKQWSVLASDILAQKYFRQKPDGHYESDARAVCERLAKAWTHWGQQLNYLSNEEAQIFFDEIAYALIRQIAAPNSPQWFNTGLHLAYGMEGEALGHWYVDERGNLRESENGYEHPQAHACFIQSVKSDLVRPGGLMDLWAKEARLFKLGSGTGTNFSVVPGAGEPLPGGGLASGLMGFLKVGDASAAAIRSGGVTRRAAKMVILDADHPDIEAFIDWKLHEEYKVACLISGSQALHEKFFSNAQAAPVFDGDFNGEAYASVGGQNSNNSIRLPNKFFHALKTNQPWQLKRRLDSSVVREVEARSLWQRLCYAAWACADPGVQFSDAINFFHTCKNDGEIRASNPCSEYLFLDDTGCNLASINLLQFYRAGSFDHEAFHHACHLLTKVLDITVSMAQYPSKIIAERSHLYRTLGLGYANLGGLLMAHGVAYDSEEGRAIAATITSLMTAAAYEASTELARKLGAFPRFNQNRETVIEVLERQAALGRGESISVGYITWSGIKQEALPKEFQSLLDLANACWARVLAGVKVHGLRNAQVSAIAPTGTIGLLMDCDTTGIEPDYALVKNKKLVGGGQKTIVNRSFVQGLTRLGYSQDQIDEISAHVLNTGEIISASQLNPKHGRIFQTSLGQNALSPMAHLQMIAACGPFVSGGISKTINIPSSSSVEDVSQLYMRAYELGVKSISLYRDGSKLSQPLSAQSGVFLPCPKCGKKALVPAGTCHKCENCGETTSCS